MKKHVMNFNKSHNYLSNLLGVTAVTVLLTSNSYAGAAVQQMQHPAGRPGSSVQPTVRSGGTQGSSHQTIQWKDSISNSPKNTDQQLSHVMLVGDQESPEPVNDQSSTTKNDTGDKKTAKSVGSVPTPEEREQCSSVIKDNFKDWIKMAGGSGDQITLPEIGKLLEDPNLPPEQAAAVAALAHYFYALEGEHDTHPVSGLSLKQISQAIEDPSSMGKQAKYATQLVANFHTAYENVRQDTHADGWSLWGDHDPPILSENVQWKLNDCYLVSAVNGVIRNDRNALQTMIKQTGKDTFVVKFPGYDKPIDVKLTAGEVAAFSYSRHGGCYLAVIGMAVVQVMKDTGSDKNQAAAQTPLGPLTDTHTFGWVQKNTFHLLTGKEFVQIQLKNYTTSQWKQFIENALNNHELIGTDYGQDQHFLTIIGLKEIDGQLSVIIKNPWGNSRPFEGHEGKFGVFTIPLDDMVSTKFGSITIQKSNFDKVTLPQDSTAAATSSSEDSSSATPSKETPVSTISNRNNAAQGGDGVGFVDSKAGDALQMKMVQGSSFVAHNRSVQVSTDNGVVHIAPRAVAYIVQIGKNVAVYNVCSKRNSDVSVVLPNSQNVTVSQGHELLLTTNVGATFDNSNLRASIPCKNIIQKAATDGVTAFDAQFAITDVLQDAPGFNALVNSQTKEQSKIVDEILKTAAVNSMTGN